MDRLAAIRSAALAISLVALAAACRAPAPDCEQALRQLDQCNAGTPISLLKQPANRCELLDEDALAELAAGHCPARLAAANRGPEASPELQTEDGYTMTVLSQQPGLITVELLIDDVTYRSIERDGVAYHELEVKESGSTSEPGKPVVPIFFPMLAVPPATDSAWVQDTKVLSTDVRIIGGIHLAPAQDPNLEGESPTDFLVDESFYARDEWYPGNALNTQPLRVGTWRNYRVVRGTLAPIQFNPARGELRIVKRAVVTVGYSEDDSQPADTVATGQEAFAPAYDHALTNYYEVKDGGGAPAASGTTRYLVLAADELAPAVQPLVDYRIASGVSTAIVRLSTIADPGELAPTPERIKETIRTWYHQEGIEYVLLVGEVEQLPMYTWDERPGDVWYGCLEGDDPLPEVFVGRLSGNAEQVAVQIAKIIDHDKQDATVADWQKRILLVSHLQDAPGKYTANSEAVRKRRYRVPSIEFLKAYGSEQAKNEDVIARVNEGVSVIDYRGHGRKESWSGWNGEDFGTAQAAALANGERTPVVLSVACWTMGLQSSEPTLAEAWMQQPNGGAVAFLGATRPSFTGPNDDFNRYLFSTLLDGSVTEIGPLLVQASAKLYRKYGDDPSALANLHMFGWLGDPATKIGRAFRTQPPLYPNGVVINEVLANPPAGSAGDANGDRTRHFSDDEFIEIVNSNEAPMDLSGWTISDQVGVRFVFPAGTVLEAKHALVVFGGGDASHFGAMGGATVLVSPHPLQLNNDGDTVTLATADGTRVDRIDYRESLAKGSSMVRAVEGDFGAPFVKHPAPRSFSPGTQMDGTPF